MQSKGYPVQQTFQNEVGNISTRRFANVDEINMDTLEQFYGESQASIAEGELSFRSEDSYDLLVIGPAFKGKRPSFVPPLNFNGLPGYESSSDEEEGCDAMDQQVQQQNLNKPYDYD